MTEITTRREPQISRIMTFPNMKMARSLSEPQICICSPFTLGWLPSAVTADDMITSNMVYGLYHHTLAQLHRLCLCWAWQLALLVYRYNKSNSQVMKPIWKVQWGIGKLIAVHSRVNKNAILNYTPLTNTIFRCSMWAWFVEETLQSWDFSEKPQWMPFTITTPINMNVTSVFSIRYELTVSAAMFANST